ncbi:YhjD/YihY/BrkB family envelope integrity protein [Halarchaeum sp. P4]|uniref:YhjD/YihY/BrkB family envelope integrity protein n=1 Tax=Halarchaeum sp. P4 TaxID=3421639 RepID=UPI003EBADD6C
MASRLSYARTLLWAVVHEVRAERVTFLAGSVAYHAFVSLLPFLLLAFAVVSAVGDASLEAALLSMTRAALTTGAGDAVVRQLEQTSTSVSVLGLVVLLWGTLRIFRGLDTAFSDIYESSAENTFLDQLRDGVVVLVSVALAVVFAGVLEHVVSASVAGTLAWVGHRFVLVVGLAVAFYPMYYVFPDQDDMTPLEVLPGVLFAAGGLTVFESLFRVYVAYRSPSSVLASVLVFLTWLYFSGFVVLVGAAVNAVASNRSADVDVPPLLGGVPARSDEVTTTSTDRETLAEDVRGLRERLPAADAVTITVDGEEVDLPPPDAADVSVESTSLPLVSGAVRIELRWVPDETEE